MTTDTQTTAELLKEFEFAIYDSLGSYDPVYLEENLPYMIEHIPADTKEHKQFHAFCHFLLGEIYQEQDKFDKAIEEFSACLEIAPGRDIGYNATDTSSAYYARGVCYSMTDRLDESIADYTQAIKTRGNFAVAYHSRGNDYHRQGDLKKALKDYDKAACIEPHFGHLVSKIETCLELGKYDLALAECNRIMHDDNGTARPFTLRCLAYCGLGDAENAERDYHNALEFISQSDRLAECRERLAELKPTDAI